MTHPHLEGLIKEWREDAQREVVQGRNKEWADWARERHMGTASALWRCANQLEALAALPGGGVDEDRRPIAWLVKTKNGFGYSFANEFIGAFPPIDTVDDAMVQRALHAFTTHPIPNYGNESETELMRAALIAALSPTPNPHEADRNDR